MSATQMAMLFAKAAAAPGAGDPPSGDPSGISSELDYDDTIILRWTNGDSSAYTRIYKDTSTNLVEVRNPGLASWFSDLPDVSTPFWLSHYKNGQEGTKVAYTHVTGGGEA